MRSFRIRNNTGYFALDQLTAGGWRGVIPPREVREQGLAQKWESMVGTGPWMIEECITNSSLTFIKNPDYWGTDEHYPQNRLPYADQLKVTMIPDLATTIAAKRTGKIDMVRTGPIWQQVQALKQTNPDIQVVYVPSMPAGLYLRVDRAPFTDIRVRKALQMAIDIPAINKGYYGGTAANEANGMLPPLMTGWGTPFNQWPADLQQEYSYNLEKARQLMTEAGYPDGFKTKVDTDNTALTLNLLEIVKAEFMEIGVDMEINAMDLTSLQAYTIAGKHEQISTEFGMGAINSPLLASGLFTKSYARNLSHVNDPVYEDLYAKLGTATSEIQAKQIFKQMDMYALPQHWILILPFPTAPIIWQSYLKGYTGEFVITAGVYHPFARLWIDQELKKSVGR